MERRTFLLKLAEGMNKEKLETALQAMKEIVRKNGGDDFSVWQAEDLVFGYFETDSTALPDPAGTELRAYIEETLADAVQIISVCNLRLMYSSINRPLTDKSKVAAHRVFMARIKPGCAEEYLRRHHGLEIIAEQDIAAGRVNPDEMPSNNMTIWNGGDYICGYNEMEQIPAADDPNSGGNEEWELNMLKIMDWITDDADAFSGIHHEPVKRLI